MKKYFPSQDGNYRYLQVNRGNTLGNLWSTFNIDLQTNPGTLMLGRKLVINRSSDNDNDLGRPVAFEYFDGRWWSICGEVVFRNNSDSMTSPFSQDASTGAQIDYGIESDLALFDNRLWSTTEGGLYSKVANSSATGPWTLRDNIGATKSHKMAYLRNFNRLYYIDNDTTISSIDTANNVATTGDYHLDIGDSSGDFATTIVATSQEIFIGMTSQANLSTSHSTVGKIIQWDGISNQGTQEFPVKTGGIVAMLVGEDNIPYALDSSGRILGFAGSSFKEIARLPIPGQYLSRATTSGESFVDKNGFVATDYNTILIAVNNRVDADGDPIYENLPSGVWELDLATKNLTHKQSFTYKLRSSSVVTDFGQNRISEIGALKYNSLTSDSASGRPTLLAGCTFYSDGSGTEKSAIFIDTPYKLYDETNNEKRGYFVTTFMSSDDIVDKWNKLWATFKRFQNENDKIVFKYRLEEAYPTYFDITWVNETSFETTTDLSDYWTSGTGSEIEILQGTGSGSCAHITDIFDNAGVFFVTIDQTTTGATGTAKARAQNWVKMLPEATGLLNSYEKFPIQEVNTQIQIKCCMTFYREDAEFGKFVLFSTNEIMATG